MDCVGFHYILCSYFLLIVSPLALCLSFLFPFNLIVHHCVFWHICSLSLLSDCCMLLSIFLFWGSPPWIWGWLSCVTQFCLWCFLSLWSCSIIHFHLWILALLSFNHGPLFLHHTTTVDTVSKRETWWWCCMLDVQLFAEVQTCFWNKACASVSNYLVGQHIFFSCMFLLCYLLNPSTSFMTGNMLW